MSGCAWSRCPHESDVIYYGRGVCAEHWRQHAEGEINLKNTFNLTS